MNFTQEQIDTIQLPIRGKRIRLSVLNQDNQTLATLEGNCIGGSLSKNANDFVRRTGSIQLAIPRMADADTFLEYVEGVTVNVNGKIWLDKNIKIEVGIENYIQPYGVEPKTVWYNFGICLIDRPVRVFGADSYTMSFNVTDLAAKLTGDRGGQLTAITTLIPRIANPNAYWGDSIETPFGTSLFIMTSDTDYIYGGGSSGKFAIYTKEISTFGSLVSTPFGSTRIWAMDNDENNVYCGGENGKFAIYNKWNREFGSLITSPFGNHTIISITSDEENVYCSTQSGEFAIYNKLTGSFGSLIATPVSSPAYISCMVNDGENVYCGVNGSTNGNFVVYSKSTGQFGQFVSTPFSAYEIDAMVSDKDFIYCSSGIQFAVYEKSTGDFSGLVQTPFSILSNIYGLDCDEQNVYCGTAEGQFAIYNKKSKTFGSLIETPNNPFDIRSIIVEDGEVYFSGVNGLFATYYLLSYTKTQKALGSVISELAGIKNYTIYPIPKKWSILPQDIKMSVGQTVSEILDKFLDILNGWQMYFDNDGIFTVEPIPSGANDITYPFNLAYNVTDTNSVDFTNVRNQVVVYGRSHDITFFAEDLEYDSYNNLTLYFEALDTAKVQISSTLFGFTNSQYLTGNGIFVGREISSVTINVSDGEGGWDTLVSAVPISVYGIDSEYPFEEYPLLDEVVYVFRVKDATITTDEQDRQVIDFTQPISFEMLGKQQIASCLVNGNPESPYYINKGYGTKRSAYGGTVNYFYQELPVSPYTEQDYYDIVLTDNLGVAQAGDIITFITPNANKTENVYCSITNKDGTDYAINKSITITPSLSTLTIGKFGNDYTIWEMQYDGIKFVLNGICPYANPLIESGGEFDNIYADTLANERAQYDLFLHSNMQNTVTLNCVPDYSIDVNYKIVYNSSSALPPDAKLKYDFEDRYFITKQITYPLGLDNSSQQIDAIEIYDDYNYVGYAYDLPTGTA